MKKRTTLPAILLAAAASLLIACAAPKPFEYHSQNEIPKGPGLLTGEAGGVTIYSSKPQEPVQGRPAEAPAAEQAPFPPPALQADEQAFQEFQQWRRERREFEAFQQWKHSRQGSAEYEEFRDWQRWQAYKKWQESQAKDR